MTKIEWVKNPDNLTQGITVNPKTGCLNHINGLCKGGGFPCYAYRLAHGRLRKRYLSNHNLAPRGRYPLSEGFDSFYPRFWPERLEQIRKIKKPTGIFLDDMSDWMGEYWPEEWTKAEIQTMNDCPQHRFYTLTKQYQNLAKWKVFPQNCWIGMTVTKGDMGWNASAWIRHVQAKVKYLSIEPFLAPLHSPDNKYNLTRAIIEQFDWVIIGAQTKPLKLPKIKWIEEVVEIADKAKIPIFLKDNLKPLFDNVILENTRCLTYPSGRLRQEMPYAID